MTEKKFDKKNTNRIGQRNIKKQFKVDLNINEYNELCDLLEQKQITKVNFVRNAINELKKRGWIEIIYFYSIDCDAIFYVYDLFAFKFKLGIISFK